jgi:hypothetical protein
MKERKAIPRVTNVPLMGHPCAFVRSLLHSAPKHSIAPETSENVRFSKGFCWCCRTGLNCRPLPYQGSALPLSYGSRTAAPRLKDLRLAPRRAETATRDGGVQGLWAGAAAAGRPEERGWAKDLFPRPACQHGVRARLRRAMERVGRGAVSTAFGLAESPRTRRAKARRALPAGGGEVRTALPREVPVMAHYFPVTAR